MIRLSESLYNTSIFNSRIAFARSLLAMNALVTLLFNNMTLLTDKRLYDIDDKFTAKTNIVNEINLFTIIDPEYGKVIAIIILLLVFTGYIPKLSIILQAYVHLSLTNALVIVEGGEQLASNLCILLIPVCLFDDRINQWRDPSTIKIKTNLNLFFNVYFVLIIVQVAIVYLNSAVGKLYQEDWQSGICMHFWLTNNVFGANELLTPLVTSITLSPVVSLISWCVIGFELLMFACILATGTIVKRIFLILGILFHFGILIMFGLVSFYFSMMAALILYLDKDNYIWKNIKKVNFRKFNILPRLN